MAAGVAGEQVWLTILEASRRSGLSEPTLRYYEQIGLVGPVPRDPSSGHRRYDAAAMDVLDALGCSTGTPTGSRPKSSGCGCGWSTCG
ncbi:MerR family DNA-binding transcriptional regulator [Amycolatopsis sp. NPDC004378]